MRDDQVGGEEMEDSSREIQAKRKGGDLKGCKIKGHLRRGRVSMFMSWARRKKWSVAMDVGDKYTRERR